jgi:hypothetical protein
MRKQRLKKRGRYGSQSPAGGDLEHALKRSTAARTDQWIDRPSPMALIERRIARTK